MAVSLFFYYCCPLNLMDQKKNGQEWFRRLCHPDPKPCLIREEPHYLKTQARSPILEDFGLE